MYFLNWFLNLFNFTNGQVTYLYYDIAIFAIFAAFLLLNIRKIRKYTKIDGLYFKMLLLLLLAYFLIELFLVTPTHLLYNDEWIYASIAKTILTNHIIGICSFSTATYCIPGTAGLFHQPGGWPLLLSAAFYLFGVSFPVGYNLVLLISVITVALVFYVTLLLTNNQKVSLLASAIFAFTPLFMTFSRSMIVDIPAAMFEIFSIFALLLYLRDRSLLSGMLTITSIAVTLSMKVDAVIILPVILAIFLLNNETFRKRWSSRDTLNIAILIILLFAISLPEIIFLKNSTTITGPGAFGNISQPLFSVGYLEGNFTINTLFWFGRYTNSVMNYNGTNFTYHDEFPFSYTAFAVIGLAFMLIKKKFRLPAQLFLWFAIVFVFYTSYYGGSVLYSLGDDMRYFLVAFVPLSISASLGTIGAYDYISGKIKPRRKNRSKAKPTRRNSILMIAMLLILFSNSAIQFVNVVHASPFTILPFAAERYDERLLQATLSQIPENCTIITFQPPLWNVLGRANIYTTWYNLTEYKSAYDNMTRNNCVYFDRSIDCYLDYGGVNTESECGNFTSTHILIPLNTTILNGYTWNNVTLGIYIVAQNSTQSNTSS